MADSTGKRLRDTALATLLATADAAWWIKGPATLVSELAKRFGSLSVEEQKALADAPPNEIRDAIERTKLGVDRTEAGVDRIETQLGELCAAIQSLIHPKESTSAVPCDPAKYLKNLHDKCRYIDIRGLQVGSGKAMRFEIDRLYIPLTTTATPAERPGKGGQKGRADELAAAEAEPVDLRESLKHR